MIDNRLRFTYRMNDDIDYEQEIFYDNGKAIGFVEVVNLLNAFNRDNDKLRIDKLKFENKSLDLQKENEQLRQELAEHLALHSNWIIRKDRYENELLKENEQLRNSIKAFLEEADMFSENATDHDIVAYREMMRFDNKDAFYLACAIAEMKKVIK